MVCKHITDTFHIHLTHLALLSSLPTPSAVGADTKISWFPLLWTYPWVLLLHLFSVQLCHFSSWCPDFEQFSELFTLSITILYKTLSRHFFTTFNFLSGLSYFATFPHWFASCSVMSQHIITHFLNEWISKLTKMENSLNPGVSKGLKLK